MTSSDEPVRQNQGLFLQAPNQLIKQLWELEYPGVKVKVSEGYEWQCGNELQAIIQRAINKLKNNN